MSLDKEIMPDSCPICGGQARFSEDPSFVPHASRIRCCKCGAKFWSLDNKETTIKLWNSRVYKRPVILKGCPLCGVHASIRENRVYRTFCVCCNNPECGFCTEDYATADEAVEWWNSEPEDETIAAD